MLNIVQKQIMRVITMKSGKEQREFFRLDAELIFDYQINSADPGYANEPDPTFSRYVNLSQQLRKMDSENSQLIDHFRFNNVKTYQLFQLINQKLETIARTVLFEHAMPTQWVNISAGGMAFREQYAIAINTDLTMRLILLPKYTAVELSGTVVDCVGEQDDDPISQRKPYRISVKFYELTEHEQQLLMQHVFHSQAKTIREQKKVSDTDNNNG